MRQFNLRSCFSFLLSNISDIVYFCLMGGVASLLASLLLGCCVVSDFLGPWLSDSRIYVLSFGRGAAVTLILCMLLLFTPTSIQSPSSCLSLSPCPPHCQLSLSSFTALCFGHLSSLPFSNLSPFRYSSLIFLYTLAYWKHTAFLFHIH